MKAKVICLIGGSGSGKDSIKELLPLPHLISFRTRQKRKHEVDGIHGYFSDNKTYFEHSYNGMILTETIYNGHRYWTNKEQYNLVVKNISPIIYVVDWDGAQGVINALGEDKVVTIWLDVEPNILEQRMISRGDEPSQVVERMQYYNDVVLPTRRYCNYVISNTHEPIQSVVERIASIVLDETFKKEVIESDSKKGSSEKVIQKDGKR